MKYRNEPARALRVRAGNSGVAVTVDTRPKTVPKKTKRNDRKRVKTQLRKMAWENQ